MNEQTPTPQRDMQGLALTVAVERQNQELSWSRLATLLGIEQAILTDLAAHANQVTEIHVARICSWLGIESHAFHLDRPDLAERRLAIKQRVLGYALPPHSIVPDEEAAVDDALRFQALTSEALPYDLNQREWSVMELVCAGLMVNQIAEQLYISQQAVIQCIRLLLRKLHVASTTDVQRIARDRGWFEAA